MSNLHQSPSPRACGKVSSVAHKPISGLGTEIAHSRDKRKRVIYRFSENENEEEALATGNITVQAG